MTLENHTTRREQLASPQDLENIDKLIKSRGTASSEIFTVKTFPLQNAGISLRAGTSDAIVYYETFLGLYHIPIASLRLQLALVVAGPGMSCRAAFVTLRIA
jgi:hypothetical protein